MDKHLGCITLSWPAVGPAKYSKICTQTHLQKSISKLKFTFSEKATKIDKTFTVNLTVCSNHQIDGKDFVNNCGLVRKHKL